MGDVEITVGVDVADIACCPEPVGCRRQHRRAAQIAVSGTHRRAQINLTELTGTHRLALLVQDAHFGVPETAADTANVRQPLVTAQCGDSQAPVIP